MTPTGNVMIYCLDTGFFHALLASAPESDVVRAWDEIGQGEAAAVISSVVCYELRIHALRGSLPPDVVDELLSNLPLVADIVWIQDLEQTDRTARLAHGNGLSMADAFILAAAVDRDADRLYTMDADLMRYEGELDIFIV